MFKLNKLYKHKSCLDLGIIPFHCFFKDDVYFMRVKWYNFNYKFVILHDDFVQVKKEDFYLWSELDEQQV